MVQIKYAFHVQLIMQYYILFNTCDTPHILLCKHHILSYPTLVTHPTILEKAQYLNLSNTCDTPHIFSVFYLIQHLWKTPHIFKETPYSILFNTCETSHIFLRKHGWASHRKTRMHVHHIVFWKWAWNYS